MRRYNHFLKASKDKFANYQVFWHIGNYHYQIENRTTGSKVELRDTSFEEASEIFERMISANTKMELPRQCQNYSFKSV
jgi:hypothetical protein